MKPIETAITGRRVVSREEWLKERVALLEREVEASGRYHAGGCVAPPTVKAAW